jgi:hypothetical protein
LNLSIIDANTSPTGSYKDFGKDIKDPNKSLTNSKDSSMDSKPALVVYTFDEIFNKYEIDKI